MADESAMLISLATFSRTSLRRHAARDVDEILSKVDRESNTWIHVAQPGLAVATKILDHFELPGGLAEQLESAGALELDTSSDRYVFKKFRFVEEAGNGPPPAAGKKPNVLIRDAENARLTEGSGSIVVGDRFVLLFEDQPPSPMLASAIDAVLDHERGLREYGIEYLLCRLAKALFVDNYFTLMRQVMDRLQDLEPALLKGSTDAKTYREVTRLRRALNPFERSLMHAGEFAATVADEKPGAQPGLRYLSGNLANDFDRLEKEFSMLRDRTSELIQTYRDNLDAQLNNTMRRLTVLSAIFLPLSFITGFYGMNFPGMPTLHWTGTFPIVLTLMIAIVAGGLIYARRRKWL